jgi:protein SCO1/2
MRFVIIALLAASSASAQLNAIGVDERPGAQVPLDVPFIAPGEGSVTLKRYANGKHPTLLVMAYARCTMLCSVVLRGVTEVVPKLSLEPGRDFSLVLVGLDPRETIDEASRKQAALLAELGRVDDRSAFPYLVGQFASIDAVANALGFRYAWDPRTEQFAHAAVIFVLTPDGRISRYLHGVRFEPQLVEEALFDAAAGRTMSTQAAEVLRCFRFDSTMSREGKRAERFLQVGAAVIFLMLAGTIAGLVRRERRKEAA